MPQINRYVLSFILSLNLSYFGLCVFIYFNFKPSVFFLKYTLIVQIFKSIFNNLFDHTSVEIILLLLVIFVVTFNLADLIICRFMNQLLIEAENADFKNSKQYQDVNFLRQKMFANFVLVGNDINVGNVIAINENNLENFCYGKDNTYCCSEGFLPRLLNFVLNCNRPIKLLLQVSSLAKLGNITKIDSEVFYFSNLEQRCYLVKIVNIGKYTHYDNNMCIYNQETGEAFQLTSSTY